MFEAQKARLPLRPIVLTGLLLLEAIASGCTPRNTSALVVGPPAETTASNGKIEQVRQDLKAIFPAANVSYLGSWTNNTWLGINHWLVINGDECFDQGGYSDWRKGKKSSPPNSYLAEAMLWDAVHHFGNPITVEELVEYKQKGNQAKVIENALVEIDELPSENKVGLQVGRLCNVDPASFNGTGSFSLWHGLNAVSPDYQYSKTPLVLYIP